jgi:hypothetical protein
MNTLTISKEQKNLIVAVLCQKLVTAYRLLSKPATEAGNKLTRTGRDDLELFASELCQVLLALEMPVEEILRIAGEFRLRANGQN